MPVEALTIGPIHAVAQTTAYALPARACLMQATQAVETSIDNTNWVAQTLATTQGVLAAAVFFRCTASTACQIVLKAQ
jgi:hypothetical protein